MQYVDGANLYEYALGNPLKRLDSLGTASVPCTSVYGDLAPGNQVFPPLEDWVPHFNPNNLQNRDTGGFLEFYDHWLFGGGVNLFYASWSGWSKWLNSTQTVGDMKSSLSDTIGLQAIGVAKTLPCDEAKFACFLDSASFPFNEGPIDWGAVGSLHIITYSICWVEKSCCVGGFDCKRFSANCSSKVVAWDSFHWNRPGTSYYWHALLGNMGASRVEWKPKNCYKMIPPNWRPN